MCNKDVTAHVFLSLDAIVLGAQMFLLQPGEKEGTGHGVVMRADTLHHITISVIRRRDFCLSSSAIAESNRTKNTTEATDATLEFPSLLFLPLAKTLFQNEQITVCDCTLLVYFFALALVSDAKSMLINPLFPDLKPSAAVSG